jgi:hypothetical protein
VQVKLLVRVQLRVVLQRVLDLVPLDLKLANALKAEIDKM